MARRYIVRDGLRMAVKGRLYRWWLKHRGRIEGSVKTPPEHHPTTLAEDVIAYAHASLHYAGQMIYTESRLRTQLYHRRPGDYYRACADCSAYGAALLHWSGDPTVVADDDTATLWTKGAPLSGPELGCGVIFGAYPGEHFAFCTAYSGGEWYCVGFGTQQAPDRNRLADLQTYFADAGYPGIHYLRFSR